MTPEVVAKDPEDPLGVDREETLAQIFVCKVPPKNKIVINWWQRNLTSDEERMMFRIPQSLNRRT